MQILLFSFKLFHLLDLFPDHAPVHDLSLQFHRSGQVVKVGKNYFLFGFKPFHHTNPTLSLLKLKQIELTMKTFSVCRARLDLGFIIDGSGSIEQYGRGNFKRCLGFVKNMVRSFTISQSYVRIGIVLFSTNSRLILRFNQNRGVNSILRTIDRIRYPRRGTRTGRALSFAKSALFYNSGRGRSKIAVIMTDGVSQDSVRFPAQALRRRGVKIFSLGIGKMYNMGQLLQMAGNRKNVFIADFRNLGSVVRAIKQKACKGRKLTIFQYGAVKTSLFLINKKSRITETPLRK